MTLDFTCIGAESVLGFATAHGIGQAAAVDLNKEQSGYTARILRERHREH